MVRVDTYWIHGVKVVSEIVGGIRNPGWYPKSWVESEILGGIRNPGWYPKSWAVSEILGGIRNRRVESEIGGWESELSPCSDPT